MGTVGYAIKISHNKWSLHKSMFEVEKLSVKTIKAIIIKNEVIGNVKVVG